MSHKFKSVVRRLIARRLQEKQEAISYQTALFLVINSEAEAQELSKEQPGRKFMDLLLECAEKHVK